MGAAAIAGVIMREREDRERRHRLRVLRQMRIMMRNMRDISNPFLQDQENFRRHYRMPPHLALELVELLDVHIRRQRRSAIPVHLQVLAALRFYGEGCLQKGGSRDFNHPMSQATFSRCLDRVTNAILEVADQFITFPANRDQRERIQNGYQFWH